MRKLLTCAFMFYDIFAYESVASVSMKHTYANVHTTTLKPEFTTMEPVKRVNNNLDPTANKERYIV